MKRLGKTGYQIKHVESDKVLEAPRNHLFPFAKREEDGKHQQPTKNNSSKWKQMQKQKKKWI